MTEADGKEWGGNIIIIRGFTRVAGAMTNTMGTGDTLRKMVSITRDIGKTTARKLCSHSEKKNFTDDCPQIFLKFY